MNLKLFCKNKIITANIRWRKVGVNLLAGRAITTRRLRGKMSESSNFCEFAEYWGLFLRA